MTITSVPGCVKGWSGLASVFVRVLAYYAVVGLHCNGSGPVDSIEAIHVSDGRGRQ